MKFQRTLRSFILTVIALYLTALAIPGFTIESGIKNLLITSTAFTLLNIFIRPIIKILLLPINLITLGAFRWLINISLIYLLTLILPAVSIHSFHSTAIPLLGPILPALKISQFIALFLVSFFLSFSQGFLLWLIK